MIDLKEIKKLSVAERVQLVEAIWDSIEEGAFNKHFPITKEQQDEIERRLDRYERGESKVYTWEEVKQRALGK